MPDVSERRAQTMTIPIHSLGTQAQMLARKCGDEKLAMNIQILTVGCLIIITGMALVKAFEDKGCRDNCGHR
jgi:hypothetical protein